MQKSPDSRAVIRLFGRLEAWGRNGQPIEFHSERSKQLLAALVLEKGVPVKRDVLVASLWNKGEEERLRHNLSTEVWRLRRSLSEAGEDPSGWLCARAETLSYKRSKAIWVDIDVFDDVVAARQVKPGLSNVAEELGAMEGVYRGDLLSGVLDEWCQLHRESYRRRFLVLLETLLAEAKGRNDWPDVIRISRRILAEDSFLEHAHREVMRGYAMMGDRPAALRHYESLCRDLQRELGVSPARDTKAICRLIRDDCLQDLDADTSTPAAPQDLQDRLQHIERHLQQLAKDVGDLSLLVRRNQSAGS
jgi:DNA-binding SARP family transcriptional activator